MDNLKEQIASKQDERKQALTTASEHAQNGDLEKAKEAKAKADEIKADIEKLQSDLAELEELANLVAPEAEEKPAKEETEEAPEQPEEDEEEAEDPSEEEDEDEKKKPTKKEQRNMDKINIDLDNNKKALAGIGAFIKTKGKETRGLTSTGAEALIPVEVINQPKETPETVVDLRTLANRVKVKSDEGKYPVLANPSEAFPTVEELAKNPEIEASPITKVEYEIKTYRQQLPISQEALDDTEADLGQIVADYIAKKSLVTANNAIANQLAQFAKVTATSLDDLKNVVNVQIDPAYNIQHVMTQSAFNAVDTLKDSEGRYVLQQDVTSPSGYKLFGRNVYIVKDTAFGGKAGAQQAFIGSVFDAILFADRAELGIKWVENTIYGQILAGVIRFDAVKADENAGRFVTFNFAAPAQG